MKVFFPWYVLVCAVLGWVPLRGGEAPRPLIECCFEAGLNNSGTAGGVGSLSVYGPEDAPVLSPGPWGRCLDLSGVSRFGGMAGDTTPAGAAVRFSTPALDNLGDFTVTFWMRVAAGERGVASRIATKLGSWEILYTDGAVSLYVSEADRKRFYRSAPLPDERRGRWVFVGIVLDAGAGKVDLFLGGMDSALGEPRAYDLVESPSRATGPLQIGNFEGIRPFRGLLDNVRVYPRALTADRIRARFQADREARTPPALLYSLAPPPNAARAFHPPLSAIPFSSRWQRSGKQGQDLFRLLGEYHATHMLWVYGTDAEFVRRNHALGLFYEGTLNGMFGASLSGKDPDASTDSTGRAWDFDGRKFVPGHMERWPRRWRFWRGCHNNPDFRRVFREGADTLVGIGCDAIHVDDWEMVVASAQNGRGCFCPHCMKRFRDDLRSTCSAETLRRLGIADVETFDYRRYLAEKYAIADAATCRAKYREIFRSDPLARRFLESQRRGLRDFYREVRRHLDAISPQKYIPVSVNNQFNRRAADGRYRGYYCADVVDFFIGEATRGMQSARHFIHCCKLAEGFGIPQVMMCKPVVLGKAQAAMATAYALGAWMRVPWDVYMDNDPKTGQPAPRYFGKLNDWGGLYDFIHQHAMLFDGYRPVATVAIVFDADTDTFASLWALVDRLSRAQIQFRVIPVAAEYQRLPLRRDILLTYSHVIVLGSEEHFPEEDRRVLASVRTSLCVRFLPLAADVDAVLRRSGRKILSLETSGNLYAFLRVNGASAVVHLVNWNTRPDGTADPFENVTLRILQPSRWGTPLRVRYYRPGRTTGLELRPEVHRDMIRLSVPRLETWGILEIVPTPVDRAAD